MGTKSIPLNGHNVVMIRVRVPLARISVKVAEKLAGGRDEFRRKRDYAMSVYRDAGEVDLLMPSGSKLYFKKRGSRVEWFVHGYSDTGRDVIEVLFPFMTKEQVAELYLPSWRLEELNKKYNPDQALVGTVSA